MAVTDLDGTDMFLGHNWLVKHNPEVNWKNSTIKFTRYPSNCTMTHKDIRFNSRRAREMIMDKMEQDNSKIGKELDMINPEDLPEYIRPFTHLFNKKKFEKLPTRREWDHKINLMDKVPKELNAKAYAMMLKKESPKSVARQTTQGWAHRGIEVKICNTLFLHPKERWFITIGSRLQKIKLSHNQGQDTTTFDWRSN